jgi:hypothetical protein
MIPLPFLAPADVPAHFSVDLGGVGELAEGRWPGLDVICDGVLTGAPFVYPAEKYGAGEP